MKKTDMKELHAHLHYLKLPWVKENLESQASKASKEKWTYVDFCAALIEGEAHQRMDRATQRRLVDARFPVVKTLDTFDWSWPKAINQIQVRDLFRLQLH